MKRNRLSAVQVGFVSLVDKGAHQDAHVVIHKRDTEDEDLSKGDPTSEDNHVDQPLKIKRGRKGKKRSVKNCSDNVTKTLEDLVKSLDIEADENGEVEAEVLKDVCDDVIDKVGRKVSSKRLAALKDARDYLVSVINDVEEGGSMTKLDDSVIKSLPDEVQEFLTEQQAALEKAETDVEELTKELADAQGGDGGEGGGEANPLDAVLKSADPVVREHIEKIQREAEEAKAIAKAEQEARLDREYLSKSESMDGLPVEASEFASVLKTIGQSVPAETMDSLMEVLSKSSGLIKDSDFFQEIGKAGGDDDGSATSKIEKAAKAHMASDPSLTKEAAVSKALDENPGLYAEYMKGV